MSGVSTVSDSVKMRVSVAGLPNERCSSKVSREWLDSHNIEYDADMGATPLRRLVYVTMATERGLSFSPEATDKELHALLEEHMRRHKASSSPPPRKKKCASRIDRLEAMMEQSTAMMQQVASALQVLTERPPIIVKREVKQERAPPRSTPIEIDLTSDNEEEQREHSRPSEDFSPGPTGGHSSPPNETPPPSLSAGPSEARQSRSVNAASTPRPRSPSPADYGDPSWTWNRSRAAAQSSADADSNVVITEAPPLDGDVVMTEAGSSARTRPVNRKGKRSIQVVDSDSEQEEGGEEMDYYSMNEDVLRSLMQRKGLDATGSRARMAFLLQKHEAGDTWVDDPVPQIPADPITFQTCKKILDRTVDNHNTHKQYLGYFRRLDERGALHNLCDPDYIKTEYLVRQRKKDGNLKKRQPQTVGKLPDAFDLVFKEMEEMQVFRLLFNNNRRNLDEVKAAGSKQELMMLFKELRDLYRPWAIERNEAETQKRREKDPELTEQQKAQCVLPTQAMLEDDRFKKRHRKEGFKDQLQLIYTCQEWLKLHLHINRDALRNDLAKLRVDDPIIKNGRVYIDYNAKQIIIYRPNKTGTDWNYDTLIKVDRQETWEMLMEMVRVQKLLGRKYVFCNTYICNRGEKKGKWVRQSENYYGKTFSEYFGRVFKTKDRKFSPRMLRTLATCEQNVQDNVPQAYELPYRQAKGKNHSVVRQMENDYNNRAVPAYAEAEYAKRKAAEAARPASPILFADDGEDDEADSAAQSDAADDTAPLPPSVFDTDSNGKDIAPRN
ncbi:hypothetical protein HK097_001820 [Rhizophlyctis rosea]|uniref:Uncharacterized protein n=1 Tax=Rhizophlyctis rosea TaxID=64517 RepID=A0AAD5S401_9FUNG|nr:hypothetical protein HK097_001820 [Rhizophlyctis rosea]